VIVAYECDRRQCNSEFLACAADINCLDSADAWQASISRSFVGVRSKCTSLSCLEPFFPINEAALMLFMDYTNCLRPCETFSLAYNLSTSAGKVTVSAGTRIRWYNNLNTPLVLNSSIPLDCLVMLFLNSWSHLLWQVALPPQLTRSSYRGRFPRRLASLRLFANPSRCI
jgi:hypothetical protein